jgi:hypothetical protein
LEEKPPTSHSNRPVRTVAHFASQKNFHFSPQQRGVFLGAAIKPAQISFLSLRTKRGLADGFSLGVASKSPLSQNNGCPAHNYIVRFLKLNQNGRGEVLEHGLLLPKRSSKIFSVSASRALVYRVVSNRAVAVAPAFRNHQLE